MRIQKLNNRSIKYRTDIDGGVAPHPSLIETFRVELDQIGPIAVHARRCHAKKKWPGTRTPDSQGDGHAEIGIH